jgi:hypothetical protein
MKIATYVVLLFTAVTLAAPAPKPEPRPNVDEDVIAFMNDILPMLPNAELQERQLPTQAACYTACDRGAPGFRAFCAILPPTPIKVACFGAAGFLGTPFGKTICRRFCNVLP